MTESMSQYIVWQVASCPVEEKASESTPLQFISHHIQLNLALFTSPYITKCCDSSFSGTLKKICVVVVFFLKQHFLIYSATCWHSASSFSTWILNWPRVTLVSGVQKKSSHHCNRSLCSHFLLFLLSKHDLLRRNNKANSALCCDIPPVFVLGNWPNAGLPVSPYALCYSELTC